MCFFFKLHSQFKCILKPSLLLLALQITSSLPLNTAVASQQVFPLCPSHHVFFVQWNIWSKSLQSEMGWCHWSNPPMYSHMAQTRGWSLYNHPWGPLGPSATPFWPLLLQSHHHPVYSSLPGFWAILHSLWALLLGPRPWLFPSSRPCGILI